MEKVWFITMTSAVAHSATRVVVGLRQWRRLANMTQQELARRVNISVQTISDLERGRFQPRLDTAQRLVRELKAPNTDVLFPPPPPRKRRRAA